MSALASLRRTARRLGRKSPPRFAHLLARARPRSYTSAEADIDVSRGMASKRAVEPLYNLYWRRLTETCCAKGGT